VRFWLAGLVVEVAGGWFAWVAKLVRWKKSELSTTWQAKRWTTWWSWWARWTTGHIARGPSTFLIRLSPATRRRQGTHLRPERTAQPEHNRLVYLFIVVWQTINHLPLPPLQGFFNFPDHQHFQFSLFLSFPDIFSLYKTNARRGLPLRLFPPCLLIKCYAFLAIIYDLPTLIFSFKKNT